MHDIIKECAKKWNSHNNDQPKSFLIFLKVVCAGDFYDRPYPVDGAESKPGVENIYAVRIFAGEHKEANEKKTAVTIRPKMSEGLLTFFINAGL